MFFHRRRSMRRLAAMIATLGLVLSGCAYKVGQPGGNSRPIGLTKAYFSCKSISDKRLLNGEWRAERSDNSAKYAYEFSEDGSLQIKSEQAGIEEWKYRWVSDKEIVVFPAYQNRSDLPASVGKLGDLLSQESMDGRFVVLEQENNDSLLLSWIGNSEWHYLGTENDESKRVVVKLQRSTR